MPWEKSFDEESVVEKAMAVFWEKGYEATSINDLLKGTGLSRGSLYNAFGGKQPLFVRALHKYHLDNHRATLASLEAMDDPVAAIRALFEGVTKETVTDQRKRGCFLVNTTLEFRAHDEDTQRAVRKSLDEATAFFRRCIEVGQVRAQIPESIAPQAVAKLLLSLMISIRVLGRGAFEERELHEIAEQAIRLIS